MPRKRYNRRLGTTAGCMRRLLDSALRFDTKDPSPAQEDFDNIIKNGEYDNKFYLLDYDDINDAVTEARRRGILPGRPGTQQDSSGPVEQTVS